jgi:hypothetical protein
MQKPGTLLGQRYQAPGPVNQAQPARCLSPPGRPVRDGQRLPMPDTPDLVFRERQGGPIRQQVGHGAHQSRRLGRDGRQAVQPDAVGERESSAPLAAEPRQVRANAHRGARSTGCSRRARS